MKLSMNVYKLNISGFHNHTMKCHETLTLEASVFAG